MILTPEIDTEGFMPQKRYHKNSLDCTGTSEKKVTVAVKLKNYWKTLYKHAIINYRMVNPESCIDPKPRLHSFIY